MMVAALAVTGFVSCSNDDDDSLPKSGPVSIVLTADDTNVEVGGTVKISSTISGVSFESSNESIATVASDGTVTASEVGKVTITATKSNDNDGTYEYSYTSDSVILNVYPADALGTYKGTMTVGTMSIESTVIISADGVNQGGNYGSYTKVLWLKNTDGNYVVAAQSDSTNTRNGDLTVDNYSTAASCYITFGDTVTYTVPAMNTSMTLTKQLPYTVAAQTDLFGTYTGSMTVMGNASEVSLTIADGKFTLNSGHPETYTKILWLKNTDGNCVVAAQSDSTNTKNGDLTVDNYTTASSNYIVFGTDTITYYVPAMAAMGGTCTLTKSE